MGGFQRRYSQKSFRRVGIIWRVKRVTGREETVELQGKGV